MDRCEINTATVSSQEDLIRSLLQAPPSGINLPVDVIENIINGENLVDYMFRIEDGKYLDGFLSSLDWWLRIARLLLEFDTTEHLQGCRQRGDASLEKVQPFGVFSLGDRLKSMMRLFAAAFTAPTLTEAIGRDPSGLVLVKQYHELKVFIGTHASALWPDERWEKIIAEA